MVVGAVAAQHAVREKKGLCRRFCCMVEAAVGGWKQGGSDCALNLQYHLCFAGVVLCVIGNK